MRRVLAVGRCESLDYEHNQNTRKIALPEDALCSLSTSSRPFGRREGQRNVARREGTDREAAGLRVDRCSEPLQSALNVKKK